MNIRDELEDADYKGMLDKATVFVRKANDKFDDIPEPYKSIAGMAVGISIAFATSAGWALVVFAGVVGVRLWGTLNREDNSPLA